MIKVSKFLKKSFIFIFILIFLIIFGCDLPIFNFPPIVKIVFPEDQYLIRNNKLEVSILPYGLNENIFKVRLWIEDTDIEYIYYNPGNKKLLVNIDLSSLPYGLYNLCAEAYNYNNQKSQIDKVKIIYNEIIKNSNFLIYTDNWGLYEIPNHLNNYLNNKNNGDWLYGWNFYIWESFALDNKPEIILDGNSIRYRSTVNDGDGNAKFQVTQYLNYKVSNRTKLYIKFKITNFSGGNNPTEAPIKIGYKFKESISEQRCIASYSNLSGPINPPFIVSSLSYNLIYEYSFYLYQAPDFVPNGILEYIFFWVNGHFWDATIYDFRIYEE
ncbi:MAG: hypothetical protein N3A58_06120 [Spirochaetes bacterium]|nr:hypothetical protein [Spirochaetota bacterium]